MDSDHDTSPLPGYFQELQQEKKKLELKLDQLRMRKEDIEVKQDAVSKKNLALNQKNDNMKRTVDVAKRKCQETQLHVDKLQKINDELQQSIQLIKGNIKNEEKNKDSLVKSYQEKYIKLAEHFRNAKQYYVDPVLREEEKKKKLSCTEKRNQLKSNEEMVKMVTHKLEKAMIENAPDERPALSCWSEFLEDKDIVLQLLQEEQDLVSKTESRFKASIDECNRMLDGLQ